MEIVLTNTQSKNSEIFSLLDLDNIHETLKRFSSIKGPLEVKILTSKGSLMEENLFKISWILSNSNKEKISEFLLLVLIKTISIELNLEIVFY